MNEKAVQGLILLVVVVGLGYVVVREADGWADWVVFSVVVLTTLGGAIAIYPRVYAKRKRTISRSSSSETPPRKPL